MRIRKNAKLSPLLFSSHASAPEALQSHVCQLNQSPWDVIPFAQDFPQQYEGEDSLTGNGSLGDSIGAVESVASMMDIGEDKAAVIMVQAESMIIVDNDENENDNDNDNYNHHHDTKKKGSKLLNDNEARPPRGSGNTVINYVLCQKNDGKGWQCKREATEGHSFCDHHLTLLRSYSNNNNNNNNNNNINFSSCTPTATTTSNAISSSKQKSAAAAAVAAAAAGTAVRRSRGRAAKKSLTSNSTNPYEFYYYSGFGPLWGRKRGERIGAVAAGERSQDEIKAAAAAAAESSESPPSSSTTASQIDNGEFDYVDDDDDEDDGSGDSGKKRMRKPIKARSLKSLM